MTDSPPQNDTPDYEAQYFTVLANGLAGEKLPAPDDYLNVNDGPQARRDADGNIAVLFVLTPNGAALLREACEHTVEHGPCPDALALAEFLMLNVGAICKNFI